MPLNTTNTNPVYVIGRLAAIAESARKRELKSEEIDALVRTPLAGLGAIHNDLLKYPETVEPVMALIEGADIPEGPLRIEDQGPYWLGYYHQKHALKIAWAFTVDDLRAAGKLLFGERWQTDLAKMLDRHDASRIRGWLSGRYRMPPGIITEIMAMLRQRSSETAALAKRIEESAREKAFIDSENQDEPTDLDTD